MVKTFLLALLCFIIHPIFAKKQLLVSQSEVVIGKNSLTKSEIKAKVYIFPERIFKYAIDSTSNLATVQLRGLNNNGSWLKNSGNLLRYDMANQRVNWFKKISYQQTSLIMFDDYIIQTLFDRSYWLNNEDGKNGAVLQRDIRFIDHTFGIAIGYPGSTDLVEGISLKNGNSLWTRVISHKYGWNSILQINDTTLLVGADGLHFIGFKKGSGWDYQAVTGDVNYTRTAIANTAGIALGVLTGTFILSGGADVITEVVSNILVDSTHIFMASKKSLVCLDHAGQVKWSAPLPEKLTSKSSIYIKDSVLYVINRGYAYQESRKVRFGTPFFAAFDLKTGNQRFFTIFEGGNDQINDFKNSGQNVLLAFSQRLANYSERDGSLVLEKSFVKDSIGGLGSFIGQQVYMLTDSTYQSITSRDSTSHVCYTTKDKIVTLDQGLNVSEKLDYAQIYICYLYQKNYRFLCKAGETIVIDKQGHKVASFRASENSILRGFKLFDAQDEKLVEIDVSDFLKE